MPPPDSSPSLSPGPRDLMPIVQGLVRGPWPKTEVEREVLFGALGFVSGNNVDAEDHDSPHQMMSLDLGLPGKMVSFWDTYRQQFLSVCTHLYGSLNAQDPVAQYGYEALQAQLSQLYGTPERPWDDEDQSVGMWRCNGRSITLQLFDRSDSTVMLTIEDLALASIIEAEEAAH